MAKKGETTNIWQPEEEIALLEFLVEGKKYKEIVEPLNEIRGIKISPSGLTSKVSILRREHGTQNLSELIDKIKSGKSRVTSPNKSKKIKTKKLKIYTTEEKDFLLRKRIGNVNYDTISKNIKKISGNNRTPGSVQQAILKLQSQYGTKNLVDILYAMKHNEQSVEKDGDIIHGTEEKIKNLESYLNNFDENIYKLFEKRENRIYEHLKNQADILSKGISNGNEEISTDYLVELFQKGKKEEIMNVLNEKAKQKEIENLENIDLVLFSHNNDNNLLLPLYSNFDTKSKGSLFSDLYTSVVYHLMEQNYNPKKSDFKDLMLLNFEGIIRNVNPLKNKIVSGLKESKSPLEDIPLEIVMSKPFGQHFYEGK